MRVDPGRRSAAAIGLAVIVVAVLTGVWVFSSQPRSMPVATSAPTVPGSSPLAVGRSGPRSGSGPPSASPVGSSPASGGSGTSTASSYVVVDVAGKVRRPGLYRLPPGSRVDDAVKAAGGALHAVDLGTVNLAAKVVDGQQIAVGQPGVVGPAAGAESAGSANSSGSAGGPVNLNMASLEQLETLPGIGPALGQRILDYRTGHGSFSSVDQLDDVSGIGTVIFARLKPLVTV